MARRSKYCPPSSLPTSSEAEPKAGYSLGLIDANGLAMKYDERGRPIGTIYFGVVRDPA